MHCAELAAASALLLTGACDCRAAALLRRQTTRRREGQAAWYDDMRGAVRNTIIISEILDTRTRHLIQARASPCLLGTSCDHVDSRGDAALKCAG